MSHHYDDEPTETLPVATDEPDPGDDPAPVRRNRSTITVLAFTGVTVALTVTAVMMVTDDQDSPEGALPAPVVWSAPPATVYATTASPVSAATTTTTTTASPTATTVAQVTTTTRRSAPRTTTPPPAPKPKPATAPAPAGTVEQIVDLANDERAKAGCAPLRADSKAQLAAQRHADDMAARDYYEHRSPEGTSAGDRLSDAGYQWSKWGENIHKGPTTAAEAMQDWMNSSAHRANILDCGFTHLGVGVNFSANGPWWVQVFGAAG